MSQTTNKLSQFWQELKRRKVIHVIIVYVTVSIVLIGLVADVFEPLGLPDGTPLLVIIILAIGFPIVVMISWFFGISIFGEKKEAIVQST